MPAGTQRNSIEAKSELAVRLSGTDVNEVLIAVRILRRKRIRVHGDSSNHLGRRQFTTR